MGRGKQLDERGHHTTRNELKTPGSASDCDCLLASYITQQVFQVVVGGALALVLGELLHVAVQAEVQPGQLLLHLAHVLQLFEGAHLT